MDSITVKFVDFWPTFDRQANPFVRALSQRYQVEVIPSDSPIAADLLFYSRCGNKQFLREPESSIRIYYTGENDVPDFNCCDYALSFHRLDFGPRHMRFPLYLLYEYDEALNPPSLTDDEALSRDFCSVVLRNANNCDPRRIAIIDAIGQYKPLAYGGPRRNNVGAPVEEKIPFIKDYKFNLALENSDVPGYVTEKIVEPFAAPTVPIYWGTADVVRDFNPAAFINAADFPSISSLMDEIKRLDSSPADYLEMLRAPRLTADTRIDYDERLADFLCSIASTRRRFITPYGEQGRLISLARNIAPIENSPILFRLLRRISKL